MNNRYPGALQRAGRRAAVLMVTLALGGCDNVEWGGIDVSVREPEVERVDTTVDADTVPEAPALRLPSGPVLFHVRRQDAAGTAVIEPIAELTAGGLNALGPLRPDRGAEYDSAFAVAFYPAESTYPLFRGPTRVGSFIVRESADPGSGACPALRARGWPELRPGADTLSEFLAWPAGTRSGRDTLETPGYRSEMRPLSRVLAQQVVRRARTPGNWRMRGPADLRAARVGDGRLGFAVTFMVGDELERGSPPDSAGTVFLVADHDPARGYFPLYAEAEWYGPGGKRALRWLDAVDLVGDDAPEWVVRAYGDLTRWYEVIGRPDTARAIIWSSRRQVCETVGMMSDE